MTDNVKHSTSYFHEVVAKAFEMFKNGYEPVMETPFQPRRQGSAFVVEYKLVRESFDDLANQLMDHMKLAGQPVAKFTGEAVELKDDSGKVIRVPGVVLADKINVQVDSTEIENANQMLDNPPAPNSRLKSVLEEGREVFKDLVENSYDENLNELAQQEQELDMGYDKQLTIHEKWEIDDEINFEGDEQKKLAESEDSGKMFYTKQELDKLYWTDLQEVGRKLGVKQRDRKKLTKMILEAQEKEK